MQRLNVRKLTTMVILALVLTLFGSMGAAAQNTLLAKGKTKGSKAIKVYWQQVTGATSYTVSYTSCTTEFSSGKSVKVKGSATSYKIKGLEKGGIYKFYVTAYKNSTILAKSVTCHVALKNNKRYTNAKKITIGTPTMTIAVGSSVKVKATLKKEDTSKKYLKASHDRKIRYISTDTSIATVGTDGTVKAVKEGSCMIYAIAQNGLWSGATVKVTAGGSTAKEYKLSYTFKYEGAEPDEEDAPVPPDPIMVKSGSTINKPSAPKLKGYKFTGWSCDYKKMPEKAVTMTGTFVKQCTITYLLYGSSDNDDYGGEKPVLLEKKTVSVNAGTEVSFDDMFDLQEDDYGVYGIEEAFYNQLHRYISNGLNGKGPNRYDLFPYDGRDFNWYSWYPAAWLVEEQGGDVGSILKQVMRDMGKDLGIIVPDNIEDYPFALEDDVIMVYELYYHQTYA